SLVPYPAVSLVSLNPEGSHNHSARDARALAQGRLSLLLALEIAPTGRAATNRDGAARADPANEHGEPALGRATHPRRIAQARVRDRAVECRQVHGPAVITRAIELDTSQLVHFADVQSRYLQGLKQVPGLREGVREG